MPITDKVQKAEKQISGNEEKMTESEMDRIHEVLVHEAEEIRELYHRLDQEELQKVIQVIEHCTGKLILTGCGTSGAAARKIAHTFNCVECPALYLSPAEALHGGMGIIKENDVVFFISKGGQSFELNEMLKSCAVKGAVTVAVTEGKENTLAEKCSLTFMVKVSREPDAFGMLATASTLAVIAAFDAISIRISEKKHYTKESFLINHPNGAVGRMLNDQVREPERAGYHG